MFNIVSPARRAQIAAVCRLRLEDMMRLLAKTSFDGGKGIQLIPIPVTANLPGTGADWFGPARRPDQSESFMLVKGNSGFGIELLDELTIRKSASGTEAERLK